MPRYHVNNCSVPSFELIHYITEYSIDLTTTDLTDSDV